jgi:hypothetical protein
MAGIQQMIEAEGRPAVLRKVGGLLFGVGMFMIFLRKSSDQFGDTWGDFALFLVLAVPAVVLYGLGLRGDTSRPTGGAGPSGAAAAVLAPWRAVYLVFGLLLIPLALFQLIDVLGGDTSASLNVFWVFGLTAALGVVGSRAAGATYMSLLAGIAVIISWTALWDKVVGLDDDLGAYRWLMMLLAGLFVALATMLAGRRDPLESKRSAELVTIAGVTAVIAASLSITDLGGLTGGFFSFDQAAESSMFWEVVLLAVSVALIGYGSYAGTTRGPTYVGAIGLFFFLLIAGLDLNSEDPEGKILGWPLLLVAAGVAGIAAGMQPERPARPRPAPPPAGPQPTEMPPPPPPPSEPPPAA